MEVFNITGVLDRDALRRRRGMFLYRGAAGEGVARTVTRSTNATRAGTSLNTPATPSVHWLIHSADLRSLNVRRLPLVTSHHEPAEVLYVPFSFRSQHAHGVDLCGGNAYRRGGISFQ